MSNVHFCVKVRMLSLDDVNKFVLIIEDHHKCGQQQQ